MHAHVFDKKTTAESHMMTLSGRKQGGRKGGWRSPHGRKVPWKEWRRPQWRPWSWGAEGHGCCRVRALGKEVTTEVACTAWFEKQISGVLTMQTHVGPEHEIAARHELAAPRGDSRALQRRGLSGMRKFGTRGRGSTRPRRRVIKMCICGFLCGSGLAVPPSRFTNRFSRRYWDGVLWRGGVAPAGAEQKEATKWIRRARETPQGSPALQRRPREGDDRAQSDSP